MAAFQSRSTVSGEAFLGHYPVVIFSQLGGLSWLQIGRDLQPTGWPFLANIRSRSTVSGEALIGYNSVEIFSQMGGLYWLLSGRDLQSDGWSLFATIQPRSSVRWVAIICHYPFEIFSLSLFWWASGACCGTSHRFRRPARGVPHSGREPAGLATQIRDFGCPEVGCLRQRGREAGSAAPVPACPHHLISQQAGFQKVT